MKERMIRILMAKMGEGGGEAILKLSKAFRDAGFEVIFTDTQKPEAIVASAIQEAVDHIGITTFPGADLSDLGRIRKLLDGEGLPEIRITAGGFIAENDKPRVREMGVAEFFMPGTSIPELIAWARENITSCYN
jgi:methylmalonyl-CoA mutase C-terminal domain/subunit